MKILITYLSIITLYACLFLIFLCEHPLQGLAVIILAFVSVILFAWSLDGDV